MRKIEADECDFIKNENEQLREQNNNLIFENARFRAELTIMLEDETTMSEQEIKEHIDKLINPTNQDNTNLNLYFK